MQQLVVRPLHCSPLGQVIYIVADGYYVLADVYRLYTPQHLVAIHYSTASYHRLVEYLYTLQHFDYSSMYMYGLYLGEILYSSSTDTDGISYILCGGTVGTYTNLVKDLI